MYLLHAAVAGQKLDCFAHIRYPAIVDGSFKTRDHAGAYIFILKLTAEKLVGASQMYRDDALAVHHHPGKMYHGAAQCSIPQKISRFNFLWPGEGIQILAA
jgi:hypothetical protein